MLEGVVTNGRETVAARAVKPNIAKKSADDVEYKRDGVQARMPQSQRGGTKWL